MSKNFEDDHTHADKVADERVLWMLRVLGDEFGPLGVLQVASAMWPEAAAVLAAQPVPDQVGDWHPDHPDRVAARAERDARLRRSDQRQDAVDDGGSS